MRNEYAEHYSIDNGKMCAAWQPNNIQATCNRMMVAGHTCTYVERIDMYT